MEDSHRTHCPRCTGDKIHRSRRRGFFEEWILPMTGRRPYRCVGCGYRYYRNLPSIAEDQIAPEMRERNAH